MSANLHIKSKPIVYCICYGTPAWENILWMRGHSGGDCRCDSPKTLGERTSAHRWQAVLALLPHVTRAKLSLPCSIDTAPDFHTVQVLATTFDALAKRDEEYDMLESVVIKNLNTVALVQLCHNHMDLRNVQRVFEGVKNLVIDPTFRSHELDLQNPVDRYVQSFVFLAKNLETLCISTNSPYRDDDMRTWESVATPPRLPHLRCLELRGISFYASDFLNLCQECAGTLKEIYLLDVKLRTDLGGNPFDLWIGNPNKPHLSTALWIAPSMAAVENLCLVTLRATRLSYTIPGVTPAHRKWSDMADEPNNAFDERFVAIAMREQQLSQTVSISTGIAYSHDTNRSETDAVAFPRDMRKSSVNLQHGIDDIFADRSIAVTQVLGELLDLIEKAVEDVNKEIEHTLASDSFV